MTVIITTPRLIIRRPVLSDLDAIHSAKLKVWPELQKWMSWAYDSEMSRESTAQFIRGEVGNPLCGFDRENGNFVIATGIDKNRDQPDSYATGYWVSKEYLGKGYATESTNAVIRYAFVKLKAPLITINYYLGNEKSRRVIEKLGFHAVGVILRGHKRCSDGTPLDVYKFEMQNADNLPALEVTWN